MALVNPPDREVAHLPDDTPVGFIPMDGVGMGRLERVQTKPLGEIGAGYTHFRDGDIILAKITPSFENGKGAICSNLPSGIGFGTTELHVLRPRSSDARFLWYLLHSKNFMDACVSEMKGVAGQQRFSDEVVREWPVTVPAPAEQRRIAAFLDHHAARIDALIAKKRRLLELIREKKSALVTEAVDHRNVPRKPLKHVASIRGRVGWRELTTDDYVDEGPLLLGVTNISYDNHVSYEGTSRIPVEKYNESPEIQVQEGDVLLAKVGATIGKSSVVRAMPEAATVNAALFVIRPADDLEPEFLNMVFGSKRVTEQIRLMIGENARGNLFQRDLAPLRIPFPPRIQQESIVERLNGLISGFHSLSAQTQRSIGLLEERKRCLITAAVTGQLDVSTWQPPTPLTGDPA